MAKVLTLNDKGYLVDSLSDEVKAIVNTIEEADRKLRELNAEIILMNLAKENLYNKLAEQYDEKAWASAVVGEKTEEPQETQNVESK